MPRTLPPDPGHPETVPFERERDEVDEVAPLLAAECKLEPPGAAVSCTVFSALSGADDSLPCAAHTYALAGGGKGVFSVQLQHLGQDKLG